jgi:hypothetical protein
VTFRRHFHPWNVRNRFGDLPRLHRDQYDINRTDRGRIVGGLDALQINVAADALHAQSARAERFERRAAHEETRVDAALREPAA